MCLGPVGDGILCSRRRRCFRKGRSGKKEQTPNDQEKREADGEGNQKHGEPPIMEG